MMKKLLIVMGILSLANIVSAQVKDISITVAPTGEYIFWNDDMALKNGTMIGGRVGFGFGRFFELRGLYMKSRDIKGDFDFKDPNFNLASIKDELNKREVEITRWGGELKANLGTGKFSPYLTIGTGVQKFSYDSIGDGTKVKDHEEEQIYASLGLGIKINLSRRIVLALEGKNTIFNIDPSNIYFKPEETNKKDVDRLSNWSGMASLEFYLGGRSPGEMTDLDRAYLNTFSDGFRNVKFVVEPSAKYIDFDSDALFNDTYMIGASAGIDFNKFIGLRGFYYQATEDREKLNFKFDDNLTMYGGNVIAKLNYPRGVVPYITVGGGYLDVKEDKYIDRLGTKTAKSGGFAFGGVGLELPLFKNVVAFGAYNALLTTGGNVKDVKTPSELYTSTMYDFGLRFMLGSKAQSPHDIIARNRQQMEDDNQKELARVRQDYEAQIVSLNAELENAYKEKDVEKAVEVIKEKKEVEKSLNSVKEIEGEPVVSSDYVKLTGAELKEMVKEVLGDMNNEQVTKPKSSDNIENRIDVLERLLLQINSVPTHETETIQQVVPVKEVTSDASAVNQEILNTLERLNEKIDRVSAQKVASVPSTVVINPTAGTTTNSSINNAVAPIEDLDGRKSKRSVKKVSSLMFDKFSAYTGPSFNNDGDFLWNVGARGHYFFSNSNFGLMPELYVGFGKSTGFGASANATYTFRMKKVQKIKPYAGLGFGFTSFDGDFKLGTNLILGTSVNVLDGNLYVDYSMRGLFKAHQIAVGYRLNF